MFRTQTAKCLVGATAVLMLIGPAWAQLVEIAKFKGIEIPDTLKFEDTILEKGPCDLEVLKYQNPTTTSFYLRFRKKGKIVCLVEGLVLDYRDKRTAATKIQEIPQKPVLKMKRNAEKKVFIFRIETGVLSKVPGKLLQFELEYVE